MIKDLKTLLSADEEIEEADQKLTAQMIHAKQNLLRAKPRQRDQ